MGIALLAIVDLWMPLQSLADRWLPPRGRRLPRRQGDAAAGLRHAAARPGSLAHMPVEAAPQAAPARPLRVIRVVDQGERRSTNRMVISGRMADVCAELDRLAALEALETVPATAPSTRLH